MSRGLQKLVLIVLLAGVLPIQGSLYDDVNDMNENDYSSDDELPNDNINLSEDEEEKDTLSKIITKPLNITVEEGETVYLPCDLHLSQSYTTLWKNGSTGTLFVDFVKIKDDVRIMIFLNNTVIIKGVTIYDTNHYYCQVIAPKKMQVVHNLIVFRNLTLLHMSPEVSESKTAVLKRGEPLTLFCNVTGYPIPKITWTRIGQQKLFPNGRSVLEGASIKFNRVTRAHTGGYKCTATNSIQTIHGFIKILVQHPPEIEIEQETVTSKVGLKPKLFCTVYAEPPATVEWFKNGKPVDDRMFYTFSNNNNRYFLQINELAEKDFGNYKCVATNSLGFEEKIIILSGSPTKPKFQGDKSTDKNMVEISWYVESYTPIIEYEFQYRKIRENVWSKLSPVIIQSVQGNIYTAKVVLLGLPPNNYKIRVRARNSNGWSLFSQEKEFSGDTPSRGGPPVIKPIVTVLPFIVAVCICYM